MGSRGWEHPHHISCLPSFSDLRGLWLYRLESRVGLNYRLKCLAWTGRQQEPRMWSQDLPACPCSLQQGQQDPRFKSSRGGKWHRHAQSVSCGVARCPPLGVPSWVSPLGGDPAIPFWAPCSAQKLTAAPFQAGGLPACPCCTPPLPTATVPACAACTTAGGSSWRGGRRGTGGPPDRRPPSVVSTAGLSLPALPTKAWVGWKHPRAKPHGTNWSL